jgi:hypothetical protein
MDGLKTVMKFYAIILKKFNEFWWGVVICYSNIDVNAQEIIIKQVTLSWFILFASSEQHKI